MFETSKLTLYYNVGGSGRVANGANDDFDLKITRENNRLFVKICPKREMELVHAEIATDYSFQKETSVLANGYQSWSLTKEWKRDELQKGIRFPLFSGKNYFLCGMIISPGMITFLLQAIRLRSSRCGLRCRLPR